MKGSTAHGEILGTAPATAAAEYSFRQRFRVPAPAAFRWCIDFIPYDWASSGGHGSRKVVWMSSRTVVLDDEFPASGNRRIRKVKLVQIYPRAKHWVSTHIVGPNHYSQFRYTILPDGAKASFLLFEGRDLRWSGAPLSPAANRQLTERLRTEDGTLWKRFAVEMERDLAPR
ncbi:MAG TPA: hypothetical protein VJ021_01355 [Thermoplasmata archaeon]|nr:hypothetical protein [Thermoplasmata archaeon]